MKEIEIRGGYVLFWGGWASNWYKSDMVIDGCRYNCCEQYMMFKKAELFGDHVNMGKIMKEMNPKEQKKMGRAVIGFNMELWDKVKYSVVLNGNLEKYRQNLELRELLLGTVDAMFVECSPYDKIWGIGMSGDHEDVLDSSKWLGLNLLGKVLDEVKGIIRNEV